MKLIIAGSRNIWPSVEYIDEAVQTLFPSFLDMEMTYEVDLEKNSAQLYDANNKVIRWVNQPTLINGDCSTGVDAQARQWAHACGIKTQKYSAEWRAHGKAAGPMRNRGMAQRADALLLLWDGESRGSACMLKEAKKAGLKIVSIATLTKEEFPVTALSRNPTIQFQVHQMQVIAWGNTEAISKLTF